MLMGNNMLTSRFNLTSNEVKFVMFMISKIKREDKPNKEYCIPLSDLKLNFSSLNISRLITFCKGIMSHTLTIKKEKSFLVVNWFSHIEYKHEENNIYFSISPKLSNELFNLEREYATPQLKFILGFKSIYTIRLYLLMYKIKNQVTGTFLIEELKEQLQIQNKFARYNDFKRKVLEVAKKELVGSIDDNGNPTEKSDIYFEYEEIKSGRKVTKIKFTVKKHKKINNKFIGSLAQFQAKIRKNYVNKTLIDVKKGDKKILLAISQNKKLYNKYTLIDFANEQAKEWWNYLYKLAKNGELEILKGG